MLLLVASIALGQATDADIAAQVSNAEVPFGADLGLSARVWGGIDRWSTGGGASGAFHADLAGQRTLGSGAVSGAVATELQGWGGLWGLDRHDLRGAWSPGAGWGLQARAAGSAVQGWGEGVFGPSVVVDGGQGWFGAQVGGSARVSALGATPGASALAYGHLRLDRHWALDLSMQGRWWAAGVAPWASGALGMGWTPWFDLTIEARAWVTATPPGDRAFEPGALGSDVRIFSGQVDLCWWLGPSLAVVAEAGPEVSVGSVSYARARALAGVRLWTGRSRSPAVLRPGLVRFAVVAPEAARVDVVGDFTDWIPQAMAIGPDGWWIEVPVGPGVYEYTYRVDGQAFTPPEATQHRDDGFGGRNGLLILNEG